MCRPVRIVAKEVAHGIDSCPRKLFSRHMREVWASGPSASRSIPHTWSQGLASAKNVQKVEFHRRVSRTDGESPFNNGVFAFTLSNLCDQNHERCDRRLCATGDPASTA